MKKVNLGLALLVIALIFLSLFYIKADKNFLTIIEQLEVINSKLDHIDYDLHELEENNIN